MLRSQKRTMTTLVPLVLWIGLLSVILSSTVDATKTKITCAASCDVADVYENCTTQDDGNSTFFVCHNPCNRTKLCVACAAFWQIDVDSHGNRRYAGLHVSCLTNIDPHPKARRDECIDEHPSPPIPLKDGSYYEYHSCSCHENNCNRLFGVRRPKPSRPPPTTPPFVSATMTRNDSNITRAPTTTEPGNSTDLPSSNIRSNYRQSTRTTTSPTSSSSRQHADTNTTSMESPSPSTSSLFASGYRRQRILALSTSVPLLIILIILTTGALLVVKYRRTRRCRSTSVDDDFRLKTLRTGSFSSFGSDSGILSASSAYGAAEIQSTQLTKLLKTGRYGAVWKAKLRGEDVAAKVFLRYEKTAWATERDFLQDPSLAHESVVQFVAADVRETTAGGARDYWIVMAYYENGDLKDYLRSRAPLHCERVVGLSQSFVAAIAFLHSDSFADGMKKTAIAHRDIKSSNVLVKGDGAGCVIADFSVAVRLREGTSLREMANAGQVGTPRYMAPEALDGRINLEEMTSFKHMDVYAMALVLWEIVSGMRSPTERKLTLPYEDLVGKRPTIDAMREVVLRHRERPRIPDEWRQNKATSIIAGAMEDCWDHDAEARLSADCVSQRLHNIVPTSPSPPAATKIVFTDDWEQDSGACIRISEGDGEEETWSPLPSPLAQTASSLPAPVRHSSVAQRDSGAIMEYEGKEAEDVVIQNASFSTVFENSAAVEA